MITIWEIKYCMGWKNYTSWKSTKSCKNPRYSEVVFFNSLDSLWQSSYVQLRFSREKELQFLEITINGHHFAVISEPYRCNACSWLSVPLLSERSWPTIGPPADRRLVVGSTPQISVTATTSDLRPPWRSFTLKAFMKAKKLIPPLPHYLMH